MVVVQVRDDHVHHLPRVDAEELEASLGRMEHPAAAAGADLGVESGVDDESAGLRARKPDEIVEILRRAVMRIRRQEIHAGGAWRHRRISERVDFVGVSHDFDLGFAFSEWTFRDDLSHQAIVHAKGQTPALRRGGAPM